MLNYFTYAKKASNYFCTKKNKIKLLFKECEEKMHYSKYKIKLIKTQKVLQKHLQL